MLLFPRRAVHSRGVQFTLQTDNPITYFRWNTYNSKEPETLDWIDSHVQGHDIFFDIGANIGVYSLYVALRHPNIKVFAFEPEFANLHLLKDNIACNNLSNRIGVFSIALSDRVGISYLHIQDLTPGAAMHTESIQDLSYTLGQKPVLWREGIGTFTLDQFCEETGLQPNCLKIDVDGTEAKILNGSIATLKSPNLRTILIEFPDDKKDQITCEKLLIDAGLKRRWHDPKGKSTNQVWGKTFS